MQISRALILVFLIIISKVGISHSCTDNSWLIYKKEFQKQYATLEEDQRRRTIFCDNLNMIHDHNEKYLRGEVTFEMGINRFADWTHEDFMHWMNGVERAYYRRSKTISVT